MLDIPEEVKNIFLSDRKGKGTEKEFRLYFYDDKAETLYPYETLYPDENLFPEEHGTAWLVIENDRIETESLSITESLSDSDELEFGSCDSSMLEITVADVIDDVTGKEFTLTVETGGYELNLGLYTVESFVRTADRRKRKITAYDRMARFNADVSQWYNELDFPVTIKEMRDSLCDYVGVTQEQDELVLDSMAVSKTIEPSQMSGLDVLKAICQINGCFGKINKMGKLIYKRLQMTGLYPAEDLFPEEELYPSESGSDGSQVQYLDVFKTMEYEDYMVQGITGLIIRGQEGDIGANVGTGENPYAIEGNFLVYGKSSVELLNIAQSLLPVISERTYRPMKIDCNAMPWLEAGDLVRVETKDDIVESFVMKRKMSGCQSMRDSLESTGSQKREEVFGINRQIIQLEGKTAVITKNVEEVSVRVTDLKNYTESEFEVTAGKIQSEVTRATEAEGQLSSRITQTADSITAEVTRATAAEGKLSSRITVNENNITLKVSKGEVSSQLSVESGKVTLSSNRLVVDSTNFKLDGNGNATFSGKITGGSININNVFTVDGSGNTKITGNHFSWGATNSSMGTDGTLTCKNANITGSVTATSGKIGGFSINGNNLVSGSSSSVIKWGEFYIDGNRAFIGSVTMDNDGIDIGYVGQSDYGHWESDTGDIYLHEIYVTDNQSFWKGWGVLETVEELWNYTHGGGWSPCPSDEGCDGGGCDSGCDSCGGDCNSYELPCDILGCGSDGGCSCDSNSCDGCNYNCDNLEGPGC